METVVTTPSIERIESRKVLLTDKIGVATFLDGDLWNLSLGPNHDHRATLPLPQDIAKTADRLTEYIEFLRYVRAEARRIRDGAQETGD
jgi:hypothetical protein